MSQLNPGDGASLDSLRDAARNIPDTFVRASQYGFLGWNYPCGANAGAASSVMNTLVPWLFKIWVPTPVTLTNMHVNVAGAGSTLTAGSNLGAIYLSDGSRIATTAAQEANWNSTGYKTMALTADANESLTVGGAGAFIWACLLTSGTTPATFSRWSTSTAGWVNGNLAAAQAAVGKLNAVTAGQGPPTSFVPASDITLEATPHWVGVS